MPNYRWQPGVSPRHEVRRIARHQVESGLADLDDPDRHKAVHQLRKRGKKVRALLRLVRLSAPDLYECENVAFRDAMRRIGTDRDAAVALETHEALVARFDLDADTVHGLASVRAALVQRRDRVLDSDLEEKLGAIRTDLETALERIETWELEEDGEGFEVVAGGLGKTYGRARDRMADAYEERSSEAFHQWRKRVKYHRYHVRLLQDVWPQVMKAHRKQLHELSDLLGDDHDLAVLRQDLVAEPERYGGEDAVAMVCALLDRRRAELQADAQLLGRRCFTDTTDQYVERIEAYWQAATHAGSTGPLADQTVASGH
jgi:CHAD domain-containing protein